MISELHPLEPFLPVGARLLMLGSFPPQRVRWSRDNPIEKQCFRQFSSSSARGRSGAVVGCGSDLPGDRDDGTEGYRCDRAPCRLCRAACGRECGVRLCGPYASALSYALFVAGLSETGGVEGGLLPADVRCVRDALIELPVG